MMGNKNLKNAFNRFIGIALTVGIASGLIACNEGGKESSSSTPAGDHLETLNYTDFKSPSRNWGISAACPPVW